LLALAKKRLMPKRLPGKALGCGNRCRLLTRYFLIVLKALAVADYSSSIKKEKALNNFASIKNLINLFLKLLKNNHEQIRTSS
jgi:hypothetical protein